MGEGESGIFWRFFKFLEKEGSDVFLRIRI